MKYYNKKARQAGMTLIELTVVLLILVGLAGLLVPYVGSFVQTTHDSVSSENYAQLNNAFARFVVEKNRMPHHVESLINHSNGSAASGATGKCETAVANDIYCGLFNTSLFTATQWSTGTHDIQLNSLIKAGLSMLVNNDPNVPNKTFGIGKGMIYPKEGLYVAKLATASDLTAGMGMEVPVHLQKTIGGAGMDWNTACYDYIAVGLGDNVELVSNTMTSSPVNFPESADQGPLHGYGHYLAILQVDKSNSPNQSFMMKSVDCSPVTEKAKFIGTALNVPESIAGHLVGIGESLSKAYENKVETTKIE